MKSPACFDFWHALFRCCMSSVVFAALSSVLWAQVDHRPQWISITNLSYGLVDLDNFPPDDFTYCRWGNIMSSASTPSANLTFTWLTKGPFSVANP